MEKNKIHKEFFISSWAVENRTTVLLLLFLIVFGGIYSYTSMPKAAFPDIVLPQIYVGIPYPGNSPADMEKLITKRIEKEIKTISEVDKITSNSIQGYSVIVAEFDSKVTPDRALDKVKDAVDKARSANGFPQDLPVEPNIFEMNFSEFPILNINLSGDFSLDRLKDFAEFLKDEIENIDEISKVEIRGLQEKEIEISVDPLKMEAMRVTFDDIEWAVTGENVTIAGGELISDNYRRTLRVVGDFSSIDDFKNIIVKREAQKEVYLKDVAEVYFTFKEATSYAREFGKPVVMLDIVKKSGENLLAATEKIYKVIEDAKANHLPENLALTVTNDMSSDTRSNVSNLENSIIFGVLLVIGVLTFFLGLRDSLFVGTAIPLSMFLSFIILNIMGITVNMMVLFALIMGLGMLVDNGIVVVENIHRLMNEGYSKKLAAKYGVGEIAWPIISSTATTLAAFFPMIFWPGMMGEFMGFLPITLIIVLGSSLFVALVVNPALSHYMRAHETEPNKKRIVLYASVLFLIGLLAFFIKLTALSNLCWVGSVFLLFNAFLVYPAAKKFQYAFMPKVEAFYKKTLEVFLRGKNPRYLFFSMFVLLIISFVLLGMFTPKVEFFPINMPKYVNIFIEKPIGTDINNVNELTQKLEKRVLDYISKYEEDVQENGKKVKKNFLIKSMIAQVGEGTSDPSQGITMGNTPHKARIQVSFVDYEFRRGINTREVMDELREVVQGFPGVTITVDKDEAGPPMGPPINIEVSGDNYEQLITETEKMKSFLISKNIPGVEELRLDIDLGKPELLVNIDREKARRLNLSTAQIAMSLRTALYGKEISQYKKEDDDYPINIRLQKEYRDNLDALLNMKIIFRDQTNGKIREIPISSVAEPQYSSTFSAVNRKNLSKVITIYSNVLNGYNANEVVQNIKKQLQNYTLPQGINYNFTGQQEDQAKEMSFLLKALLIGVFSVLFIIVAQFNSFGSTFIILTSVLFSLIGVFLGLVIFQMDFIIIMTMIGIISLAGVVVNNAIVLLDYTNLLMDRKKQQLNLSEEDALPIEYVKECIAEAGGTRLRPVLLTAITTVLGLFPLAVGMNINFFSWFSTYNAQIYFGGDNVIFWGPLSWTVIFGLTFATFLTLVVVPIMFLLKTKIKYRFSKSAKIKKDASKSIKLEPIFES